MFVFIPGSIPPVRFGPGGTDPAHQDFEMPEFFMPQLLIKELHICAEPQTRLVPRDCSYFYDKNGFYREFINCILVDTG